MNNFMIFGPARSGTTTLAKILVVNGINLLFEPFNSNKHKFKHDPKVLENIFLKNDGVKHLIHQLEKHKNEKIISKYPTIFIYRKNFFECAISYLVAEKTSVWQAKQVKFKKNYVKKIKISKKEVVNLSKKIGRNINFYTRFLETENKNHIVITYEDLYSSETSMQTIKKVFEFIKKPLENEEKTLELLSPKYKLNKKPWSEVVVNYNKIQKYFLKLL